MPTLLQRSSWKALSAVLAVTMVIAGLLYAVPIFASQVTADGLVGYWKLDETSAGTFADVSGHANTGTGNGSSGTNNTPQPSSDVPSGITFTDGRSLSFDGVDDVVVMPASSGFNYGTGDFTWAAWVFPTNLSDSYEMIISQDSGGVGLPYFALNTSQLHFYNGTVFETSLGAIAINTWQHVVVKRTSGVVRMYINGTDIGTTSTQAESITNTVVTVGRYGANASHFFHGSIDDVRIYNRALSATEIADLAAGRHTQAKWTAGSGSTKFESKLNWSGSIIPDPYTRVTIPFRAYQPTLTGAVSFASLTINTGASLRLGGTGLTLKDSGTFTNYGTLQIKGNETLTSFTNDTIHGTVLVYGTGSYTPPSTGLSYYNLNLNDGLVGYWKLDETSGTRAVDSSGYGNSGTLLNSPTISSTVAPTNFTNARSLSFDGTDDYVATNATLNLANDFTWSVWVYRPAGQYIQIMGQGDGTLTGLYINADTTGVVAWYPVDSSVGTVPADTWTHLAAIKSGATWAVYINGTSTKTGVTWNRTNSTSPFDIGRVTYGGGLYYNGVNKKFDDVRIYNRALSAGEIAALAAGNQPSLQRGTVTLNGALDVNNDLVLNGGTLDVSASNYGITVGGNWLNNGGVFTARSGTVTFDGTSSALQILSGGQRFDHLTLNGAGATWTLADRLTATGTLSLTAGTLDVSTSNYTVRAGTVAQTSGTFTPRSGLLVLTSPSSTTVTITSTLNSLQIEDPTEYGLIGYWKFDEGTNSGAILDSSGYGNTGVRHGGGGRIWSGSTLPSLQFENRYAMQFDGADDYVDTGRAASTFISAGAGTISVWYKPTGTAPTVAAYYDGDGIVGGTPNAYFGLYRGIISGSDRLYAGVFDGSHKSIATSYTVGAWTHLVWLTTGSQIQFYKDGVLVDSVSSTGPSVLSNTLVIGLIQTAYAEGSIDDVRIYNRALSAAEVRNLANGHYADGDNGTATLSLGANLTASSVTLLSGTLGGGSRTISVSADWNNYAGTGGLSGLSTVDLNGSGLQVIRGSTDFYALEISTTTAQTVKFGSGTVQSVSNALTLSGQNSALLTLSPLATAYTWYLDIDAAATQTIQYVNPSYSNASQGAVIIANGGTNTNGGNNTNWQFTNPTVYFSLGSLTRSETSGSASLIIHLSGSSLLNVTVPYSVSGTATGTGADFTLFTPLPIVFNAAETNSGIVVLFVDDSTIESDETMILTLGTPTNASLGATGSLLTLTLTSDDVTASSSSSAASEPVATPSGGSRGGRDSAGMQQRIMEAAKMILARFEGIRQENDRLIAAEDDRERQLAEQQEEDRLTLAEKQREDRIAARIDAYHKAIAQLEEEQKELAAQYAQRREERLARAIALKEQELTRQQTALAAEQQTLKQEQDENRLKREQRLAELERQPALSPSPHPSVLDPNLQVIAARRGRLFAIIDNQPIMFSDVSTDEWYAPFVSYVISEQIAQGYKDAAGNPTGEFGVEKPVTRAELLKMALEASQTPLQGGSPRNASAKGTWASSYVFTAEALKLSVYASDTDVHAPASRGEVIQTILEAMKIPTAGKTAPPFSDVPTSHRYAPAIAVAAVFGLIEGDSGKGTFRPNDPINRAEVAKIISLARETMNVR